MKLLKKYFKTVQEIYDYFDYTSGKQIYPLEDYTDFEWTIRDNKILYSLDEDDKYYIYDEYIEEHKGEEYTMFLIIDSLNLDDCLVVFDNKKYLGPNDYRN